MQLGHGWMVAMLTVTGLVFPACARTAAEEAGGNRPAQVKPIRGTDIARVILSADAAKRLDVHTAPVRRLRGPNGGTPRVVIPYAAVLYDANGDTWAYTNPKPLVFVRAAIRVHHITGRTAALSSGPTAGTKVVTVGAAELLGTEYQVGEE